MKWIHDILIACTALFAIAPLAFGQRVTIEASSQQAFVDEPTRVVLRIDDADRYEEPTIPEVDGLSIRRLPGEQTSTSIQIINGRSSQRRTVLITYEVVPLRVGRLEIPPLSVKVGDRSLTTRPVALNVVRSETGDLMLVSVSAEPEKMYVGEKGSLNLEIAVRRYRDAALGIALDEGQLWSLIDSQSSFGAFGPAMQKMAVENRRPQGRSIVLGDTEYFVYTVAKPFDPIAAGVPDIGDVRIRMQYPTKLRRENDVFFESRLSLAGSRPISATPAKIAAEVLNPPEDGRPASWNGAVGDFEIEATAKPTDVAVGDPITVTLSIRDRSGRSALEGLRAPALGEQPAISGAFRIPSEPPAGTVEGRAKVFTQTLRAMNDTVREIPPLEFSFFDPASGQFRVARSAPLAITVKPSATARVSLDLPGADTAMKPSFTKVEGGLLANASLEECEVRHALRPSEALATAALPALAAFAGLVARRVASRPGARRAEIRRRARARAESAIKADPRPERVEAALLAFIAERCSPETPSISRKDAGAMLAGFGVSAEERSALDEVLRECERVRYHGGSVDSSRALAVVASIERATAREVAP